MRFYGLFVKVKLSLNARLNEELSIDIRECAIAAKVSDGTLEGRGVVGAVLCNLLSCNGMTIADQVCVRGQWFPHVGILLGFLLRWL
jgi:hypothetical protein